jgi:hypothetical protein
VTQIDSPGIVADSIELDLERYQHMSSQRPLSSMVSDTAEILRHVVSRLRSAEAAAEVVLLDWEILHLIDAFRAALRVEARDRGDPS